MTTIEEVKRELEKSSVKPSIPLYFFSRFELAETTQVAENVHLLPRSGVHVIQELKIAFFNRSVEITESNGEADSKAVDELLASVQQGEEVIDLLFTGAAPKDVQALSSLDSSAGYDLKSLLAEKASTEKDAKTTNSEPGEGYLEAKVAFELKPRYHFASGASFCQREPYKNYADNRQMVLPGSSHVHFTRFLCLAPVIDPSMKTDNGGKQGKAGKWLHALDIEPNKVQPMNHTLTKDCTENPYLSLFGKKGNQQAGSLLGSSVSAKRMKTDHHSGQSAATKLSNKVVQQLMKEHEQHQQQRTSSGNRYFYSDLSHASNESRDGSYGRRGNKAGNKQTSEYVETREDCWFCLGSPTCDRSLVISVGNSVYLSVPKGMINAHHVQIIPIKHSQSIVATKAKDSKLLMEFVDFKKSLSSFFSQKLSCVPIICERKVDLNLAKQQHCFIEVIPVPLVASTSTSSGNETFIKNVINTECAKNHLHFVDLQQYLANLGRYYGSKDGFELLSLFLETVAGRLSLGDAKVIQYIYLEIPGVFPPSVHMVNVDLEKEKLMNVPTGKGAFRVPLQLSRIIACRVLNCTDKINWKNCLLSREEEKELVSRYKKDYKAFEPNIADSDDSSSDEES